MGSAMHQVTISKDTLREVNYTDKAGQPATLRLQTAFLHTFDRDGVQEEFPSKFEIVLPRGVLTAYPRGIYTLHPSALQVDAKTGRLSCQPVLTPAAKPAR